MADEALVLRTPQTVIVLAIVANGEASKVFGVLHVDRQLGQTQPAAML